MSKAVGLRIRKLVDFIGLAVKTRFRLGKNNGEQQSRTKSVNIWTKNEKSIIKPKHSLTGSTLLNDQNSEIVQDGQGYHRNCGRNHWGCK